MRLQSVTSSLEILILFSDSPLFRGGTVFLYGLCEQHLALGGSAIQRTARSRTHAEFRDRSYLQIAGDRSSFPRVGEGAV